MSTFPTLPQLSTECPSWCTVEHTWDGPEFHASARSTISTIEGSIDDELATNLFQPVESDTPCVVVSGGSLTVNGARALADMLRMFADMAEGSVGR